MATTKRIVKGSPLTATEHDANVSAIDLNSAKAGYPTADATKVGYLTITQAVDVDTLEANVQNLLNIAMGGYGMSGNTMASTITVAGTYYKVLGTTTANTLSQFTHTDNKLVYTGARTKFFRVAANPVSMISAGNNVIVACEIAKNGTAIGYPMTRKIGTGADVGAGAVAFDVSLATNDYIELFVTNETSTATVTIEDMYVSVIEIK